jgi:arginyl-tRNA synthetase
VITEDVELSNARLLLMEATRVVLRNALGLLGVSAPDKM